MKPGCKKLNRIEGNRGELLARNYLERIGWKILEAPFRCNIGEIDIVAMDAKTLVFIEVKSRRSQDYGHPVLAVNRNKQKKIIKTARVFLTFFNQADFEYCRFDVIGLSLASNADEIPILHIKDAFRLEPQDMAFSY